MAEEIALNLKPNFQLENDNPKTKKINGKTSAIKSEKTLDYSSLSLILLRIMKPEYTKHRQIRSPVSLHVFLQCNCPLEMKV